MIPKLNHDSTLQHKDSIKSQNSKFISFHYTNDQYLVAGKVVSNVDSIKANGRFSLLVLQNLIQKGTCRLQVTIDSVANVQLQVITWHINFLVSKTGLSLWQRIFSRPSYNAFHGITSSSSLDTTRWNYWYFNGARGAQIMRSRGFTDQVTRYVTR